MLLPSYQPALLVHHVESISLSFAVRLQVLPFFAGMGLRPQPGEAAADFLEDTIYCGGQGQNFVTDPGLQRRAAPASELAAAFRKSP